MAPTGPEHQWPGQTNEAHPEIFTTMPPPPVETKPGQLTEEQVKQFFTLGYVQIDNFFDCEKELDPVRRSIEKLVDVLADRLYNAGKIKHLHKDKGLFKRLTLIDDEFPGANIMLHKQGQLTSEFRSLWSNERMLNIAEQLLGTSDIVGHPVWNLRTKTPKNEATTVPWHQDVAYLDQDSYSVLQMTAWIPFLDTNEVNGCMQVVEGGHRTGRVATHQCCHGGTWYVMLEEPEIERSLAVDMKKNVMTMAVPYGGMLLFNNLLPHRSLPNLSQDIRWSMDLRWQRADKPVGFYGIKHGVRLRSSTDPDFVIDWDSFDALNRHKGSTKYCNKKEDEFDVTITGPWMKNWEIVHVNSHVASMKTQQSGQGDMP